MSSLEGQIIVTLIMSSLEGLAIVLPLVQIVKSEYFYLLSGLEGLTLVFPLGQIGRIDYKDTSCPDRKD